MRKCQYPIHESEGATLDRLSCLNLCCVLFTSKSCKKHFVHCHQKCQGQAVQNEVGDVANRQKVLDTDNEDAALQNTAREKVQ